MRNLWGKVPVWHKDNSIVMRCLLDLSTEDVFDELFKLAPEKVNAVKEVRKIKALSTSLAAAYPLPTCLIPQDKGTETGPSFHTGCMLGALRGLSVLLSPGPGALFFLD